MKINITKTELYAMPYIAWTEFRNFLLAEDIVYSSVQKTASLCLRYYYDVTNNGNSSFFSFGNIDAGELARALITIDAGEFADMLPVYKASISTEEYDKADEWFGENAETLIESIDAFRQNNLYEFYNIVDENYTIRPPKALAWLGVFEAGLFFALMIIFAAGNPKDIALICLSFSAIASLGLLLIAYVRIWRISVKGDEITVRLPFKREQTIRTDGVSDIRTKRDGIIIYAHKKRLVSVDRMFSGYPMLLAQLWLAGKTSDEERIDLIIKQHKMNVILGLLSLFFGIGAFIWTYTRDYNPANIYEKIFFTVILILTSYLPVYLLVWKVVIREHEITVRKAMREEKLFTFSDITKVNLDDQNITIFAGSKKIIKIPLVCEGCQEFIQRLSLQGTPFYKNGKKI